jgi:biofilm PGA synthesis N-glycosyltransferase PgaC
MTIFFIIVFILYSLCVIVLSFGWAIVTDEVKNPPVATSHLISVIIPFRNESANLLSLLNGLRVQAYSQKNFEIIFVDDHSTDDSLSLVEKNLRNENFKLLQLPQTQVGKKAALDFGIQHAKGEIITTTDADCDLPEFWLVKINEAFNNDKTKMVVGPVKVVPGNSLFSRMQAMEFSSLIGVAGGTIALGKPTMSNGANLSFLKSAYCDVNGYEGSEQIQSGDDEFLMRKISQRWKHSISFLYDKKAIVSTKPQKSVAEFFQQRSRWAGKWKHNSSLFTQFVALMILMFHLTFLLFFAYAITGGMAWKTALAVWALKMFVEVIFLFQVSAFLAIRWSWISFLALQVMYSFYVVLVGVLSQLKGYKWKGRDLK